MHVYIHIYIYTCIVCVCVYIYRISSGGSEVKAPASNAGDLGSIPGSGRSPEKEMATHSSILAWRIPGQRSLVGYSPQGRKESDTTERLHCVYIYIYMQINRYNSTYISNICERKIL